MESIVARQLRMKRRGHDRAISDSDDMVTDRREHLGRPGIGDSRCTNEHGRKRLSETLDIDIGLEAIALSAEGVSFDCHIDQPQRGDPIVIGLAGEDDQSRTRGQHRFASCHMIDQF